MSDPIDFHMSGDVIEAWLSGRLVGVIQTQGEQYFYQMFLPIDGAVPVARPARSQVVARRRLLQWLAGWFTDAGPHCTAMAGTIAVQALWMADLEDKAA